MFGYRFELGQLGDKLLLVVNSLFAVLTILGIVNDPNTEGMTYDIPKEKKPNVN